MTDIASSTAAPQFSASVRNSDGHLILIAWTNADTLNADLMCWDINGSGSITAKGNVVTDSTDDQAMCGLTIDTTADNLYAFYCGKTDGSETAYTSLNVYYKLSTNGGTSWGSETQATSQLMPITYLMVPLETDSGEYHVLFGGAAQVNSLFHNVALLPAAGGSAGFMMV